MNKARGLLLVWMLSVCVIQGCAGEHREAAGFGPPALRSAQIALSRALEEWKANRRGSGVIIDSNPAIGIVDSTRINRPLLDFEILGPLMPVDNARPFAVRLTLDSPRESIAARYLVLGCDPLWVFRQEDFERMLHWEHTMDAETKPDAGTASELRD